MSINTVKVAGKCLLLAVRDRLRVRLFASDPNACQVEIDETAHPITGDSFVAVMPGGFQPGPAHSTDYGRNDLTFEIELLVVKRITAVPKDRDRDAWLLGDNSLEDLIGDVYQEINWKYDVTNAANDKIAELSRVTGLEFFNHPLVFTGMDRNASIVGAEMFGGKASDTRSGMKKVVRFGHARFTDYLRA